MLKLDIQRFAKPKLTIYTDLDRKGFESGLNKIQSISKKGFNAVAVSVGAVSTALAGATTAAVKMGTDFEAAMSKVKAISGATSEDLELLSNKAKEMGATTKFSASESAEALQYMAMAGWKTQEMLDGLEGIMNLAAASGEDLATTSDIVTDALTAMGLSAKDSGHFADVLAIASSNSNTNVSMMGETFKYAASLAGSLGYNIEDTATAIGLMANAGIKGTQAGTSLRSIMSRLATNTNGARQALEDLGVEVINSDGTMRDFGSVMKDLRKNFQDLSAEEQANYAKTIAGQEALSGFLAIANSSDSDFEKLTNAIYNADGAAEQMAKTMEDNLKGKLTILKSSLEGFGISIYEELENPLKEVADNSIGYIQQLSDAFKNNGFSGVSESIGEVASSIITKVSEYAPKVIEMAVTIIESLIKGIQNNLPTIVKSAVSIMSTLIKTIISMLPELLQMGIDIIIELAKGIAQEAPTLIPQMVEVLLKMIDVLLDNIDTIAEVAIDLVVALTEGIFNALPILISKLPSLMLKLTQAIIKLIIIHIPNLGIRLIETLINGMFSYWQVMINKVREFFKGTIFEGFVNKVADMMTIGINFVKGLWEGISNSYNWIKNKIQGWIGNVMKFIKKLFGIHSPSTVMRDEVGKYLAEGMGVGFDEELDNVYRDMQNAINLEQAKLQASVETGRVFNTLQNSTPVTINLNGNVEMDSQKVGQLVTPSVTRTIKTGGGI